MCDAFPVTTITARNACGWRVLGGCGLSAYRRRGPALLLLVALLPALQIVPVMRWWSPHYLYLPLAFAAMLAVEALERWAEAALRWVAPAALSLGGLTLLEGGRYQNDERFWNRELELEPACREAHYFLGDAAQAAGRLEDAVQHYEQALDRASHADQLRRRGAPADMGVAQRSAAFRRRRRTFVKRSPSIWTRKCAAACSTTSPPSRC